MYPCNVDYLSGLENLEPFSGLVVTYAKSYMHRFQLLSGNLHVPALLL